MSRCPDGRWYNSYLNRCEDFGDLDIKLIFFLIAITFIGVVLSLVYPNNINQIIGYLSILVAIILIFAYRSVAIPVLLILVSIAMLVEPSLAIKGLGAMISLSGILIVVLEPHYRLREVAGASLAIIGVLIGLLGA